MEEYNFKLNCLDFKGSGQGSSIVITGAIHGNEQTGTYTAELIAERLKNERLLGDVRIIPVCNESAFKARQRQATQDGEDLNRVFPGSKEGSYSYQLAAYIWEITQNYDYIIDLHCCGIFGSAYTMCWYSRYDFHKKLSRLLGIETVIHTAGTSGQFYLESCEKRNQKGLLIELPGGQPSGVIFNDIAEDTCEKIINYMKLIGVIEGQGVEPENVRLCGIIAKDKILAVEEGVYEQKVKPGQYVKEGDVIAAVNGVSYYAPFDAVVTASCIDRYVFTRDNLVSIAPSEELPDSAVKPS